MDEYKIILEEKQTVMARYEVEPKSGEGYQSEAQLENALIKQLADQGYEYAKIKDEAALLENLRQQLQALNDVVLSESEWARLLPMISNEQMTILDKTEMLQGKGRVNAQWIATPHSRRENRVPIVHSMSLFKREWLTSFSCDGQRSSRRFSSACGPG